MGLLSNALILATTKKPAVNRSPKWDKVRAAFLKTHPTCACCGGKKNLEVHHIMPFSNAPELELDPNNLITLCESASDGIICHLAIGHAGNYSDYNPTVKQDAARLLHMFANKRT